MGIINRRRLLTAALLALAALTASHAYDAPNGAIITWICQVTHIGVGHTRLNKGCGDPFGAGPGGTLDRAIYDCRYGYLGPQAACGGADPVPLIYAERKDSYLAAAMKQACEAGDVLFADQLNNNCWPRGAERGSGASVEVEDYAHVGGQWPVAPPRPSPTPRVTPTPWPTSPLPQPTPTPTPPVEPVPTPTPCPDCPAPVVCEKCPPVPPVPVYDEVPAAVRSAIEEWWRQAGRRVRERTKAGRQWLDEHPGPWYVPGVRSTPNISKTVEPCGGEELAWQHAECVSMTREPRAAMAPRGGP